ncbi:DUF4136 domain-containing protein [bacterium]|nr:DUF4136 domain-containing protein [bacterium]RQV92085.1 MAG: DUF4136 domain-containing protein [bacterium]
MVKKFCFVGIVLVLILLSCSSVRVMVNYDETVSFSNYRTFRFVSPRRQQNDRPGAVTNPLITGDVMREIRPIMESKGFSEATSEETADLLVVFYAMIQNRSDYVPPTYTVGRWGRVRRTSPGHTIQYREGTLVIDIVDRQKREMIWQGIGRGVLDRNDPAENLVESVQEILESFPPQ